MRSLLYGFCFLWFVMILGLAGCGCDETPKLDLLAPDTCPYANVDTDGGGLANDFEDFNNNRVVDPGESDPNSILDDHRHITGTIDNVRRYETDSSDPNDSNTMEVSEEHYHMEIDMQTLRMNGDTKAPAGTIIGTAKVTYTNHAYRVYRHPFSCDAGQATQLNIDHPDRTWTVQLTGILGPTLKDGKCVNCISASGTPDHSDAPDTITYSDTCYSDTQPGHLTATWGSFSEKLDKPDSLDVRVDHPLPAGVTSGENSHTVHLKIAQ